MAPRSPAGRCSPRAAGMIETMIVSRRFLRIVLVSDGPDFIREACESFEGEPGFIVVATAENGLASLIAVDVLHPDLVLIDTATQGMDGIEATRRVKARAEPPEVVLITPHDPAEIAHAARNARADAVISKRELGESAECILRALGLTLARQSPARFERN